MNELTLAKKTAYNGHEINIYGEEGKPERWYTREEIGAALDYVDPKNAIYKIHSRNSKELDQFSWVVNLSTHDDDGREVKRETFLYSQKGLFLICKFSDMPKAEEFMFFIYDQMQEAIEEAKQIRAKREAIEERHELLKAFLTTFKRDLPPSLTREIVSSCAGMVYGLPPAVPRVIIIDSSKKVQKVKELMEKIAEIKNEETVEIINSVKKINTKKKAGEKDGSKSKRIAG